MARLHLLDIDGSPPSRAGRLLRVGHLHRDQGDGHDGGPGRAGPGRHAHADPRAVLTALEKAGLVDAAVVAHGAMPLGGYGFFRAAR
jgi:hypothetical protein